MHAAWSFYEEAKAQRIRPILGFEAYLAFGPRQAREKPAWAPAAYSHLVLLAEEPRRATRTSSGSPRSASPRASTGGPASTRRCSRSTPRASSAWRRVSRARWRCTSGRAATRRPGRAPSGSRAPSAATASGSRSSTTASARSGSSPRACSGWAQELGIGVVATNDAHYLRREDAEAHDVLLAIGTGSDLDDPKRFRFTGAGIVRQVRGGDAGALPGASRPAREHRSGSPSSASSTSRSATSCPSSPAPPSTPPTKRCSSTWRARAPCGATATRCRRAVAERLEYELGVINTRGVRRLLPDRPGLHRRGARPRHSGRARAAAPRRARSWPTRSASPTSARSSSTCCSSGS